MKAKKIARSRILLFREKKCQDRAPELHETRALRDLLRSRYATRKNNSVTMCGEPCQGQNRKT